MEGRVLLVDDDPMVLRLAKHHLEQNGITCISAADGAGARRKVEDEFPTAVVLDLGLPDVDGKDLLREFRTAYPELPIVVLTAQNSVDEVVECMKLGAMDYVHKSYEWPRLVASVGNACRQGRLQRRLITLADELHKDSGFSTILGDSPAIGKCIELLRRAASSDVSVLLQGESGTGKEIAARAVHAESARRTAPFLPINCGAIPEGLIESELFGHEKGAFTGADHARQGCFEQAHGGTLFLDEVGELRPDLQVRLLRVLQDGELRRVGGTEAISVDVRVLAATNVELKAAIAAREFREDLFYRLSVFPVTLPPLRERDGDVMLLAAAFLERFCRRHRRALDGFTPDAEKALPKHSWPGNVRELENVVERATLLEDGERISLASLPDGVIEAMEAPEAPLPPAGPGEDEIRPLEDEEKRLIAHALEVTGGNIVEAARRLGISRATVYRKIERYGLRREDD